VAAHDDDDDNNDEKSRDDVINKYILNTTLAGQWSFYPETTLVLCAFIQVFVSAHISKVFLDVLLHFGTFINK